MSSSVFIERGVATIADEIVQHNMRRLSCGSVWEGEKSEWRIVDGKSEGESVGLAGLARSSNHTDEKDQIEETHQRDQSDQLAARRREIQNVPVFPLLAGI